MKLCRFLSVLVLLCLSITLYAQGDAPPVPDDDFNVFLLLLATVAIGGFIGVVIVGSLVASLFFILFTAMVLTGIISVSLLAGWYKRSVARGVRLFVFLCTALLGGCMAAGITAMAGYIFHWGNTGRLLLLGSISGAAGGLLLGWVILRALRITYRFVAMRTGHRF